MPHGDTGDCYPGVLVTSLHTPAPWGPWCLSLLCPSPAQAQDTRRSSHILYLLSPIVTKGCAQGAPRQEGMSLRWGDDMMCHWGRGDNTGCQHT